MMELHAIPDSISEEESLDYIYKMGGANWIGSLDIPAHKSLSCVFNHPEAYDLYFFGDTLLNAQQVVQMHAVSLACHEKFMRAGNLGNVSYKNFAEMLAVAIEKQYGLLALCD